MTAHFEILKIDSQFTYFKMAATLNDSLKNVERKNLLAYQDVGFSEQLRIKKLRMIAFKQKIKSGLMQCLLALLFLC